MCWPEDVHQLDNDIPASTDSAINRCIKYLIGDALAFKLARNLFYREQRPARW